MQWSKREKGRDGLDTVWISGLCLHMELNLWEYMTPGILSKGVHTYKMFKKYLQW